MSIDTSNETEARITDEAQRQGISVEALLEQLMNERAASATRLFWLRARSGRLQLTVTVGASAARISRRISSASETGRNTESSS